MVTTRITTYSRHIGRCDGQRTASGGVEVSKSCVLIDKANDSDVELDAARPRDAVYN